MSRAFENFECTLELQLLIRLMLFNWATMFFIALLAHLRIEFTDVLSPRAPFLPGPSKSFGRKLVITLAES